MKAIAPLWKDPVGWTEWLAKTKIQTLISTLIHTFFVLAGLHTIARSVSTNTEPTGEVPFSVVLSAGTTFLFIGILLPAMYFYAMYRLLKIIRENGHG